jgi:hypothetical protein
MDLHPESFRISFTAEHHEGDIDFVWRGAISGAEDGTVEYAMEGEVRSTFRRNRIGLCTLHPMSCAAKPCTVVHTDGTVTKGVFPDFISPHQPFKAIRTIAQEIQPGLQAEVTLTGDVFEMEDQRNWTDASFKTYSTPLELPIPIRVERGTRITQSVTLRLIGTVPRIAAGSESLTFQIGDSVVSRLPRLGLSMASHGQELTRTEIERLRALNLAHLRLDVWPSQSDTRIRLAQAAREARALDLELEVALHLTYEPEGELYNLRKLVDEVRPPICTWLVFHVNQHVTSDPWLRLARRRLSDYDSDAKLGGGTDAFFAELNRDRPPIEALDLVSYSISPQVHATDNASLVESLAAQAVTLRSARQFCGDKLLAVSPVTLRMRFNPAVGTSQSERAASDLPKQVDTRQMSLFGAGWTAGSIKYLATGAAYSVTYYETTGWLGVMDTENGSPLPDEFPSIPGGVFPMYHVFADIGPYAGGTVLASVSSDPLSVEGLAFRKDDSMRAILTNFTAHRQRLTLEKVHSPLRVKSLDETNAEWAMRDPVGFRAAPGEEIEPHRGELELEMLPFAVVRIDTARPVAP